MLVTFTNDYFILLFLCWPPLRFPTPNVQLRLQPAHPMAPQHFARFVKRPFMNPDGPTYHASLAEINNFATLISMLKHLADCFGAVKSHMSVLLHPTSDPMENAHTIFLRSQRFPQHPYSEWVMDTAKSQNHSRNTNQHFETGSWPTGFSPSRKTPWSFLRLFIPLNKPTKHKSVRFPTLRMLIRPFLVTTYLTFSHVSGRPVNK